MFRRFAPIIALLVVSGLGACRKVPPRGRAQVVQLVPAAGEVTAEDLRDGIRVTFDRPVAPVGAVGAVVRTPAIRIVPAVPGEARWIDERTLAFFFPDQAKSKLRPSTSYAIGLSDDLVTAPDVAVADWKGGRLVYERLAIEDVSVSGKALHELFGELAGAITGLFDPGAELRDEQRTLAWYFDRLERRDGFVALCQAFFQDFDALILPSATTSAFAHRQTGADVQVDGETVSYWEIGQPAVFCNLTGFPGLSVPAGFDDDGLPIGIQIVGPRWSEMRLLEIARQLEQAGILPGFRPPPL